MKYSLRVSSIWECGGRCDAKGNPQQEDSLYPAYGKQTDADRTFILCDGMGGHDAGEVASAAVCHAMSRSIMTDGHDIEGIFTDKDFNKALNAAFDALQREDSGSEKPMGTTLAFLKLHSAGATIAHIGDSRVYHIRPGETAAQTRILFVTDDHSLVNGLVKLGQMTPEEAHLSPQRNIITRAMQPCTPSERPEADVYHTADIQPGDWFYLCSDGMLESCSMENGNGIRAVFSKEGGDMDNKTHLLREATAANSDNHSALIIQILDVTREPAQSEAAGTVPSAVTSVKGKNNSALVLFLLVLLLLVCVLVAIALFWFS